MSAGAYLVYGEGIDPGVAERVGRAAAAIEADPPNWLRDWIPSYDRIFVEYDPRASDCASLARWARGLSQVTGARRARLVELPTRYGGLDLPEVARQSGLTPEEVVRLHAGKEYRVYAVGFTPGFPFMAEVPEPLRLPRKPTPRPRVPAHAVGIAGRQTGVYPQESPGGWNLIGRTLVRVYDPGRERPFLLEPGDRVRFVPEQGEPPPAPERVELLSAAGPPRLRVLKPGLLTLPLDAGRFRAGRYGLARSGPLDAGAFRTANRLLGNAPDAPALELNLSGPLLEALAPLTVALATRDARGRVRAETRTLAAGETLDLSAPLAGPRGYLAVPGGLALSRFMGSSSPDLKGSVGRPLAPGDRLHLAAGTSGLRRPRRWTGPARAGRGPVPTLRLLPGPQASAEALAALTRAPFRVGSADRMGLRLLGPSVPGGELLSEGVPLGAVQVPPGGSPMLLLADRGTIGGYAKPAVLHPADLDRAGQLREGDRVRFVLAGSEPYCVLEL